MALKVKEEVALCVDLFRKQIQPPEVSEQTNVKDFGGLLGRLLRKPGKVIGPKESEPTTITFSEGPTVIDSADGPFYRTVVEIGVSPDAPALQYDVTFGWSYSLVADEDQNGEELSFTVTTVKAPKSFNKKSRSGTFKKGESAQFRVDSELVVDGLSVRARPMVSAIARDVEGE